MSASFASVYSMPKGAALDLEEAMSKSDIKQGMCLVMSQGLGCNQSHLLHYLGFQMHLCIQTGANNSCH